MRQIKINAKGGDLLDLDAGYKIMKHLPTTTIVVISFQAHAIDWKERQQTG